MTDLRQAAQQALEALEHHTAIKHPQQIHYRDSAIDALKAALNQQAEPAMLNGLTEAETNATASVMGLTKQAEPVALDKIKHGHTKMRLFDFEQHPDHEYAGLPHRPYASSYTEGCYLCATLAEIERLQTKLKQQAEPVQEPFGYLWPTGRHPEFRFTQQKRDGADGMPIYTASPQRQWVGLTDDEIADIAMQSGAYDEQLLAFARAIEAKLKEANNAA